MTVSLKIPSLKEPSWDEALDEACPFCDRTKGEHTLYEYLECIRRRLEKLRHALQ